MLSPAISLTILPFLSLGKDPQDKEQQVALHNFTFQSNGKSLSGTAQALEAFQLTLTTYSSPLEPSIVDVTAPYPVTLQVMASDPPCWMSYSSFEGDGFRASLCLIPVRNMPLKTFTEIEDMFTAKAGQGRGAAVRTMLDFFLSEAYHVVLLDFSKRAQPGSTHSRNAAQFWLQRQQRQAANDEFLDIFKVAI